MSNLLNICKIILQEIFFYKILLFHINNFPYEYK